MKAFLTTALAILLFTITSRAQNTFPATGNVGIGTAAPAGKLQVQNSNWDLLTATYTLDIGVNPSPVTGGWARALRVVSASGSTDGVDGGAFGVNGFNATPNYVYMSIPTTSTSPIGYNSTKILTLDNSGNVGIGTIAPGLRAHILGPVGFPATSGTAQTGILRLQGTGNSAVLDFGVNGGAGAALQVTSNGNLALTYPLLLNANGGNVGIGTTSPDQKLTVNGTIHSSEVIVDTNIPTPDYVFDKTYDLPTLTSVKNYIDKNHHLSEIPSAAEVAKNGQRVGEMNMLLLKKVEELTLYMIERDKQDEKKAAQLTEQQVQIDQLKQQLIELKKSLNKN